MPIVGMTDQGKAFPQIGDIRKGSKKRTNKKGEKIWGEDLPYFRVEFDESEKAAAALFEARYGDKPDKIVVLMPFDEIGLCWEAWREAHVAGAMWHRCDGENINYQINRNTGEVEIRNYHNAQGEKIPCGIQNLTNKDDRCKHKGRLQILIPEIRQLAYLMVHTGSKWDIINISKQLAAIYAINGNHIAGIPLVLKRKPNEISTPSGENGKRVRREKWLISIEADPEWVDAKLEAMQAAALPAVEALQIERTGDVYEGRGPDLEELEEYDDDDDTVEAVAEAESTTDLPTTGQEFYDWHRAHGLSVPEINSIFGMPPAAWVKVTPEVTYEDAARFVLKNIPLVEA